MWVCTRVFIPMSTVCDSKKLTFRFLYNCKNHCTHGFFDNKKNDYVIVKIYQRNYEGKRNYLQMHSY